MAKLDAVELR